MRWSGYNSHNLPRAVLVAIVASLGAPALLPGAAAGARKPDPVIATIDGALSRGAIDAEERTGFLESYTAARRTLSRLSGQRRVELGYVLGTLRAFARQKRLAARLRPLFLILDRNREWWAKAGPPGSGARETKTRQS